MAKFGIGVGEEFPVDEAAPPNPPPPDDEEERKRRRRHGRLHWVLHLATRVAVIALIISAIVWLFRPHGFYPGPYAPYAFHPYPHHFFFPVLLIVALIVFARRRHGCYGMRRHRHHEHRGDHREEV